ncbi:LysR family transcriptional regulator substrate-binding protein [Tessaracoccus sp. MC1627]|uniref:LysR family transcriptional regulator substrate-binding protein n=1 Tax=Tessaracoccus sp. MC1627 TaxID=2760312 RepID=UPI00351C315F
MTTPRDPGPAALRVGNVAGVTVTKWRRIWEERFPRTPLSVVEVAEADQRRALLGDTVDMCFVRQPIDGEGLHVIPLYDELPVVWMSKDHELSLLDEVTATDLVDVRVIADAEPASVELATYSAAVLHLPMSIARSHSRRDLVYRPLVDAAPTTVALAWRTDNDNGWIDEFIGVVRGRTPNSSRTAKERGDEQKPAGTAAQPRKAGVAGRAGRARGSGGRPGRR